jgi:hypothetical protein
MLFSKTETFLQNAFKIAMDMTAAGIEADTVMPIFNPRYVFPTPKTTPKTTPKKIALKENSFTFVECFI